MFGLLFNFRLLGILSLIFVTLTSLFQWRGAILTKEVLVLCGMIFLSSVFSEMKSWNLWGFKGEKNLADVPKSNAIAEGTEKPSEDEVKEAENKPIQLMAYDKGNFLTLSFEIERLLRIMATVSLAKDVPANIDPEQLLQELVDQGIVTAQGKLQVEGVRWLTKVFVQGRDTEINKATLDDGIRLAFNLYLEIFNYLNPN